MGKSFIIEQNDKISVTGENIDVRAYKYGFIFASLGDTVSGEGIKGGETMYKLLRIVKIILGIILMLFVPLLRWAIAGNPDVCPGYPRQRDNRRLAPSP